MAGWRGWRWRYSGAVKVVIGLPKQGGDQVSQVFEIERETRFELATSTLARLVLYQLSYSRFIGLDTERRILAHATGVSIVIGGRAHLRVVSENAPEQSFHTDVLSNLAAENLRFRSCIRPVLGHNQDP